MCEVISIEFVAKYDLEDIVEIARQHLVQSGHDVTMKHLIGFGIHEKVANVILKRATQKFAKQRT